MFGWRSPGWQFAALLAALLGVLFRDVLAGGFSLFYRDFGVLAYPTVHYHRQAFWAGEVPLWNPLSHCGVPFLAQWGTMACYPGALLYLLFPLPWSLNLFCVAHLWLAGLGMYRLAKDLTGAPFGATVAGVAFVFSGLSLSCLLWPNYTAALGWMPWVVGTVWRVCVKGTGSSATAAFAGTMQVLTGAPELLAMTWLVAAGLVMVAPRPTAGNQRPEEGPTLWRWCTMPHRSRLLLGVLLLVLGLSAVQLLPFFDLLVHSQRADGVTSGKWVLPAWGWLNLVAPLLHSHPNSQGIWFQSGQEFFSSVYVGAAVLALAAGGGWRCKARAYWYLAAMAVIGVLLSLGATTANGETRSLGGLGGWVRYPVKLLLLPGFALPLMSAWAFAKPPDQRFRDLLVGGLFVAGLLTLAAWQASYHRLPGNEPSLALTNIASRSVFLLGVLGLAALRHRARTSTPLLGTALNLGVLLLLCLDFQTHVPARNPRLPTALLRPGLAELANPPEPGTGRVFITPEAEDQMLRSRVADFELDFIGKRLALWSNLNLLEGIPKVNGAATLRIREQDELETQLYDRSRPDHPSLEAFLGVTHRSSPSNAVDWVATLSPMPFVTAGQEPLWLEEETILARMLDPGFNPRATVLLPRADGPPPPGAPTEAVREPASIAGLEFSAHGIAFDVNSPEPCWVVFAQTYSRHWRASINGQSVPLRRANHAFQAMSVPSGPSKVRLVYIDPWFRVGAVISSSSALVWLGLVLRRRRPLRQVQGSTRRRWPSSA